MKNACTCLVILLFSVLSAHGQTTGNVRTKTFLTTTDTISLDSLPVFKGTVVITDGTRAYRENTDFRMDYVRSQLVLLKIPRGIYIEVRYRVLPLPLGRPLMHKNPEIIQQEYTEKKNPFLYTPGREGSEELFRSEGLKMNGSLSRGLAFGNNQDVVLNSNLNLQLAGKLNNDVDVLAAISDENNPIQPEGNTQQLQDFDKVFIQLSKGRSRLVVGDFEMKRPAGSYFMNYYKKSRGAQFYTGIATGRNSELRFGGEGAVSRGRFARNVINGSEGMCTRFSLD